MKIFVGGLLPSRQQRMRKRYPGVEFTFTSDQDSAQRWLSRARGVDVAIIDQGRCSHTITTLLRVRGIQYQLADGNAAIQRIIEGAINGIRSDQHEEASAQA